MKCSLPRVLSAQAYFSEKEMYLWCPSLGIQHYQTGAGILWNSHLCLWPYKPQLKSCCYLLLGIQNHRKKFCFYIAASCVSLGVYTSRRDWNSKSMFFCSILVTKWWNMIFLEDKDVLKNISIYQHFKMKLKISHRKK